MADKPTYEELEQQIKKLHNKAIELKEEKKRLQKQLTLANIIISANPDLIVLKDRDFVYQAVNPAFCRFLGKTEEDIIGKTDFDLFPRVEAEIYRRDDLKVIRTKKPQVQDEEVTAEKERRWLRVAKTPVFSKKGTSTGVLCSVVEITDRKKTKELLRESEERYRALAENSRVGIWQTTLDGYIIYVNPAMCQMLEIKNPKELHGKAYDFFFDEKNREIVKRNLAKREKGISSTYEVELIGKNGTKHNVMISGAPIFSSDDNIHSAIGTFTDITFRKKAEEALRESEENFRTLAENANDGILIASGAETYVYANKQAAEITGYSISELLKKTIKDLSHPVDFEKTKERYRKIISGKPFQKLYKTRIIHKNGKEIPIEVTSARSNWKGRDADIVIIRDLTERVKTEKALKKAHNDLDRRVKERTKELEIKTKNLEEINTAMRVLLTKREEDKKELEYNMLSNVIKLINPYLEKIKKTRLDSQQKTFLNIMESNLQDITSQFARKISLRELNLTPTEIQVANMIRHGNSSKEIADVMNVSIRTIAAHRRNIRKKIGLNRKRANLRSYLLSLH
jgi:PAS domain S-box-containing protein